MSEIIDFVLYMFVLGPSVEWCLKNPKVNGSRPGSLRGIALAVALLAAIAGTKLSFELVGRESNHFSTLGVRTDATAAEIKRAYRSISLDKHPDKNPDDKTAAETFRKAAAAYEVLKDATKRSTYNRFGADDDKLGSDPASRLGTLSLFYIIWLVVGYLLTMGKASEDGRMWAFSGLLALAVYEYQTRILSVDYLAPVFPYSTVHEKVELLHKLFPPFLHGARMISQVIFMDIGVVNKMRLEEMQLKVDELLLLTSRIPLPEPTQPTSTAAAIAAAVGANGASAVANGATSGGGVAGTEASSPRARAVSKAAAAAADDTASKLDAAGFQPLNAPPNAQAHAAMQAAAGSGGGGAAGAEGAAGAAAGTAPAAPPADSQEAMALAARNKDRLTNVAFFFVAYAGFKYASDNGLL